jgi:hypothetical protein
MITEKTRNTPKKGQKEETDTRCGRWESARLLSLSF